MSPEAAISTTVTISPPGSGAPAVPMTTLPERVAAWALPVVVRNQTANRTQIRDRHPTGWRSLSERRIIPDADEPGRL
jgi:hypothetical protein